MKKALIAAAVAATVAQGAYAVGLDPDKITGLTATPTEGTDAANKAYVDSAVGAVTGDNLGDHTATQDLDMDSNKIIHLTAPTEDADAATKKYVDDAVGGIVIPTGDNLGDHTATQDLDMADNKIINLTAPTQDADAATKKYVDDTVAATLDNELTVSAFGGDFDTLSAALGFLQSLIDAGNPDEPAPGNPWVIKVGPGVYSDTAVGPNFPIKMTPHTRIVGAGAHTDCATLVTAVAGDIQDGTVFEAADASSLSDLCIAVTGDGWTGVRADGTLLPGLEFRMDNVFVTADGANSTGLLLTGGAVVEASGVKIEAMGPAAEGVNNDFGSLYITGSQLFGSGFGLVLGGQSSRVIGSFIGGNLGLEGSTGPTRVVGSEIDGNIVITADSEGMIVNSLISGAVSDGNTGFRNCRGNYGGGGLLGTPANSGNATAASYEGGASSNAFGEVGC